MRLAAVVVAVGLLLGSCAGVPGESPPEPAPSLSEPSLSPNPATPPAPVVVAIPPDASFLDGRTGAEIVAMLGPPDLLRRERKVELMQYLDAECALDIRLRPPSDHSGAARADHLAARGRKGEAWRPEDCLARLVPERHWPRRRVQPSSP